MALSNSVEYSLMKLRDLKAILRKHDLKTSGSRADVTERLRRFTVKTQPTGSLPASFLQMREAEELTDVTLVFGDRRLPCHKVILAGMCEYFHRMFLTDMMECYSKEIVMKDINASTGVLLVDYFYTQQIDITTNNAQDLLEASDMLLIDTLKHNVEEFLCNQADKSNCISLLNLAQFYDLKLLLKETESILHDLQVNDLIDTEDVHLLSEKHLVKKLIAGDSLDDMFCLVQKWMLGTERLNSFDSLIELLRQELLPSDHGVELIQRLTRLSLLNNQLEKPTLIVGNAGGEVWQSTDPEMWMPIGKLSYLSEGYSACAHPNARLIISGGMIYDVAQKDCHCYDIYHVNLHTLPSMPTARSKHSSIYHDEHVYVIGGNDGQSVLKSVDALDMWSLEWSSLPHMPQPLQCPYVVFVSNKLFVLGGLHGCMDPMEWSEDVYEYDSTSKTWHKRTPMPEQCPGGAAVALGDQIYVVGGSNRSCMEYNPHMDSWLHLQRPHLSHSRGLALVWNRSVLLCGGTNDYTIEEFSPMTDTWTIWTKKLPPTRKIRFALIYQQHDQT